MKRLFVLFIFLASSAAGAAQFSVSPPGATSTPPPPGPAKPLRIPQPVETALPNGLRVIAVRTTTVPLVTAELVSNRGSSSDPAGKLGAASLAAAVMPAGTATRDAVAISHAIDEIGANLSIEASSDDTVARVNATSDKFPQALAILADIAQHATFPEAEIGRARAQALAAFDESYGNIETLGREVSRRALFGAEAYGNPPDGTPATVKGLRRDDLINFRDQAFRPDNVALVIAGDIDPAAAFSLATQNFGAWPKPSAPPQGTAPSKIATGPRFIVVDKEDAGAGTVTAIFRAVPRTSNEYAAATMTNAMLNGYSARLNEEVRVKRGLAYGAGSRFVALATDGLLRGYTLSVESPRIPEATSVVLATLRDMGTSPVSQSELDTRRRSFLGERATGLQREDGIVELLGEYARYGVPLSDVSTADAQFLAITPAQIQAFAVKYLTQPTVVIVGKASVFLPALKSAYANVEVIPFKKLDLANPALRGGS
jgi:zinc protease